MKRSIIILLIITLILLIAFFNYISEDPAITGNPEFEPILNDLAQEQWFENIQSTNCTNNVTIDIQQFETKENELVYLYSEFFTITVDLYSNNHIGAIYLNSTDRLTTIALDH